MNKLFQNERQKFIIKCWSLKTYGNTGNYNWTENIIKEVDTTILAEIAKIEDKKQQKEEEYFFHHKERHSLKKKHWNYLKKTK